MSNVNYPIKDLLDKGYTLTSKSGANISKNDDEYLYQESHRGCITGDFNSMMFRFINDTADDAFYHESNIDDEEIVGVDYEDV